MTISDFIAIIALILSAYSLYKTIEFNKRQNEFSNTADHLNKLLLRKEKEDAIVAISAELNARVISVGRNNRRLKIYNKGNSEARNVRLEYQDVEGFCIYDNELPIAVIQPSGGCDLIVATSMEAPSFITIKLIWDDDRGIDREVETTISPCG